MMRFSIRGSASQKVIIHSPSSGTNARPFSRYFSPSSVIAISPSSSREISPCEKTALIHDWATLVKWGLHRSSEAIVFDVRTPFSCNRCNKGLGNLHGLRVAIVALTIWVCRFKYLFNIKSFFIVYSYTVFS